MKHVPPPHNLPVELGQGQQAQTETSIRWAGFQLSVEDITKFRAALVSDFGDASSWSDDEIRAMAMDSIALVALCQRILARISASDASTS